MSREHSRGAKNKDIQGKALPQVPSSTESNEACLYTLTQGHHQKTSTVDIIGKRAEEGSFPYRQLQPSEGGSTVERTSHNPKAGDRGQALEVWVGTEAGWR